MKIAMICFTINGCLLAEKSKDYLENKQHQVTIYSKSEYLTQPALHPLQVSLKEWTGEMFRTMDGIVFVGASGIAVRSIAPFIVSKKEDPAVIVMDEQGKHCISLLSGHLGGANELTQQIAAAVGADPVITTATDVNRLLAVDVFAKKNNLLIENMTLAKEVAAALVHGDAVGFVSDLPVKGQIPPELQKEDASKLGIYIGIWKDRSPFDKTLWLIPSCVTAGIGCRKGTDVTPIRELFYEVCSKLGIFSQAVKAVASIDLKAEEQGLLTFCEEQKLPFHTFRSDELLQVTGEFTPSAFVRSVTGVDNVCERSAVLESNGTLIQKKIGKNGVTVAFAMEDRSVKFE